MQKLDLEVAGEFLVMAATLIHLKARTLMPPLSPEQEEQEEEEVDEEYQNIRSAQDLMRQLIEYRQFKELASRLSQREEDQLRIFYRNALMPSLGAGERGEQQEMNEDISLLFSAFARVLKYTEGRPTHPCGGRGIFGRGKNRGDQEGPHARQARQCLPALQALPQ